MLMLRVALGMEFPVFLLRTVPVTCTVRSSEDQGAPRSILRQPQWLVDICLCLTVLNIVTGRYPQWLIHLHSIFGDIYLLGLFTKEILALTCQ